MSRKQILFRWEGEAKRLNPISQVKWVAIIDDILGIFEFLFGCWHRNRSRPFTLSGWTYEVCLNCGKQFAYYRAEFGCGVSRQKTVGRCGIAFVGRPDTSFPASRTTGRKSEVNV